MQSPQLIFSKNKSSSKFALESASPQIFLTFIFLKSVKTSNSHGDVVELRLVQVQK